jgi:hypothetical protein
MALTDTEKQKQHDALLNLMPALKARQANGEQIDEDAIIDAVYDESVRQDMTGGVQPHWLEWRTGLERELKYQLDI